ncbi:hypothetical protein KAFR_0I00710 [Kazachstania africana CBS 2517]|uniref:Major facilitator superfamily (MFS) profile domain-containing protein n=1 Tax=Kazachstania africana (strain ATCC 22294 / BCRC 22015 / CBS 2517 / CECT 1963 / NBRC 1671 / NRRL Y-8276) TaxID=1071382 RepID=H2AZQ2_KAZAF|nr:hypothetical protein KAFR_0I00710 [Kazachstania africana CBS 2517]CCF59852.1 hypothetical protein KAFR_0I00710 [Kazachstania africana CBS 2517]
MSNKASEVSNSSITSINVPTKGQRRQQKQPSNDCLTDAEWAELTEITMGVSPEETDVLNYGAEAADTLSTIKKYKKEYGVKELIELSYSSLTKEQALTIFLIIIFIGFLGPMSGNIYIPALPLLQIEYNVSSTTINATVSVFMAVFAVGPLFWGMFADVGGRKILYLISLLLMTLINVLLSVLPTNIAALFVLRILQAFSSSSVITLGAGTITDITPPKHRGKAIGYFMIGPNMGPIVAPIIAGLILMKGNYWRWLFGFTSIMSGVAFIVVLIFLPETLRCKVGNGDPGWRSTQADSGSEEGIDLPRALYAPEYKRWTFFSDIGVRKPVSSHPQFKEQYPAPPKPSLTLYWHLIKIAPVTLTSISTALLFANYYAFSVTFSHFLKDEYNFSQLAIGAAYVCPGIAMLLGSQIGGHLSDKTRSIWIKNHEGQEFPLELRLALQMWGIILNTVGCIGYGWSIQHKYHIAIILMFSAFLALGMTWTSNTTMTYLTELLAQRAASTVALSSFFRNIAAAIGSAIIVKLYTIMGVGWCFTGLGLCNLISLMFNWYLVRYSGLWQNKVTASRTVKAKIPKK